MKGDLKYEKILTERFFMREFVGKGKPTWRIGQEMGIDQKTIKKYLKLTGISEWMCGIYSDFKPKKGRHNPESKKLTREFLFVERYIERKSVRRIAKEHSVDRRTVQWKMDKFGVK